MEGKSDITISKEILKAVRDRKTLQCELQSIQNKVNYVKNGQKKAEKQERMQKIKSDFKLQVREKHNEHTKHKKKVREAKIKLLEEQKQKIAEIREERKKSHQQIKTELKNSHRRSRSQIHNESEINCSFINSQKKERVSNAKLRALCINQRRIEFKEQQIVNDSLYQEKTRKEYLKKLDSERKAQEKIKHMIQKVKDQEFKALQDYLDKLS